jgi:hypothetical protein
MKKGNELTLIPKYEKYIEYILLIIIKMPSADWHHGLKKKIRDHHKAIGCPLRQIFIIFWRSRMKENIGVSKDLTAENRIKSAEFQTVKKHSIGATATRSIFRIR